MLFSLLTVCPLVIEIAGELSARRGARFEDDTRAVRNLAQDGRFHAVLVRAREPLPGLRNVLIHEYVGLDMDRVVEALDNLNPDRVFCGAHPHGVLAARSQPPVLTTAAAR